MGVAASSALAEVPCASQIEEAIKVIEDAGSPDHERQSAMSYLRGQIAVLRHVKSREKTVAWLRDKLAKPRII
jgi:hypothetical protein